MPPKKKLRTPEEQKIFLEEQKEKRRKYMKEYMQNKRGKFASRQIQLPSLPDSNTENIESHSASNACENIDIHYENNFYSMNLSDNISESEHSNNLFSINTPNKQIDINNETFIANALNANITNDNSNFVMTNERTILNKKEMSSQDHYEKLKIQRKNYMKTYRQKRKDEHLEKLRLIISLDITKKIQIET